MLSKEMIDDSKESMDKYVVLLKNRLNELSVEYLNVSWSIYKDKFNIQIQLYDIYNDNLYIWDYYIYLQTSYRPERFNQLLMSLTSRDFYMYKKYNDVETSTLQLDLQLQKSLENSNVK